ncbi:hypothetical protein Ferp_0334 [Ferroglobus placidus DSM 10642]|uniref:Uncharacterized protein n=1 Tax=Ferroglobus placidus (strain DSM 10642 / AEDII12DO) TaxID=589924 RepID=D3S2I3_FERPA|nr:hypothetical protein Ferp_0334 [Ferroglobus placidus DSM 10642]
MKIKAKIKIVSGIIFFNYLLFGSFYLLSPTHESLLRLLEISRVSLVTFLAYLASKNLSPSLKVQSNIFGTACFSHGY